MKVDYSSSKLDFMTCGPEIKQRSEVLYPLFCVLHLDFLAFISFGDVFPSHFKITKQAQRKLLVVFQKI